MDKKWFDIDKEATVREVISKALELAEYSEGFFIGRAVDVEEKDNFGLPMNVLIASSMKSIEEAVTFIRKMIKYFAENQKWMYHACQDERVRMAFLSLVYWCWETRKELCPEPEDIIRVMQEFKGEL